MWTYSFKPELSNVFDNEYQYINFEHPKPLKETNGSVNGSQQFLCLILVVVGLRIPELTFYGIRLD